MYTPRRSHWDIGHNPLTPSTAPRTAKEEQLSRQSGSSTTATPVIDLTGDSPPSRKRAAPTQLTPSSQNSKKPKAEPATTPKQTPRKDEGKRLRRFRTQPPQAFFEIYQRATSQRFFVLGRTRLGTPDCPEEEIEMTGSTGNIYTVHIGPRPTCTCPHFSKGGNQCKHWLWVMSRVLRAEFRHVYQLALLSTELREIFAAAPPIETRDPSSGAAAAERDKNRKPVDGDCPICFSELEPGKEQVVWCRAACGQNIHRVCFETWAKTKRQAGGGRGEVTCPMCRSVWEGDKDALGRISKSKGVSSEGYVNVADQLGISQDRDESTYYAGPRRSGNSNWGSRRPVGRFYGRYSGRY